ncbi:hypothetical protein BDV30DRAFT_122177 [Aspergillus minisclerotigenes]|uniref:Uncharacterized protein n=1 Tax=Aspergillus minisclerotigenes TaxID=656917 RepID=A0A5N6JLC7_9EURO|nr:hypothetical protein BDV30DRAFT_122177 [Aspergillus minisclerotigenes]
MMMFKRHQLQTFRPSTPALSTALLTLYATDRHDIYSGERVNLMPCAYPPRSRSGMSSKACNGNSNSRTAPPTITKKDV